MRARSRISSKYQTVIPRAVRERLAVTKGDVLEFWITEKGVSVEKVQAGEDDPFASFREWSSAEDEQLYRDL